MLNAAVKSVKRELLRIARENEYGIRAKLAMGCSWSDLHDYFDANALLEEWSDDIPLCNSIIAEVDEWLEGGVR